MTKLDIVKNIWKKYFLHLKHFCSTYVSNCYGWVSLIAIKNAYFWHLPILYQNLCGLGLGICHTQESETSAASKPVRARISLSFLVKMGKVWRRERKEVARWYMQTQQRSAGGPWPTIIPAGPERIKQWATGAARLTCSTTLPKADDRSPTIPRVVWKLIWWVFLWTLNNFVPLCYLVS